MTDVFFSYSAKDRERVAPIRDALAAAGFDVFWDQEVPPGRNWDEWIRHHLDSARCAIVFWTAHSVKSDNVVHEATVAKNFGKLIPVLLDPIEAGQFPMGHYTTQGVLLHGPGDTGASLRRLMEEVEAKAMRRWMRLKFAELEGRVQALNANRVQLEDHEASLRRSIAELENGLELRRRDKTKLQHELAITQEKLAVGGKSPAAQNGQGAVERLSEALAALERENEALRQRLALLQADDAAAKPLEEAQTKPIGFERIHGDSSGGGNPKLSWRFRLSDLFFIGSIFPIGVALRWYTGETSFAIIGLGIGIAAGLSILYFAVRRRNRFSIVLALIIAAIFSIIVDLGPSVSATAWSLIAAGNLVLVGLSRKWINSGEP